MLAVLFPGALATQLFDILRVTNVSFPNSDFYAASLKAPYDKDIPEFTVCLRFQITSYNDGLLRLYKTKFMREDFGYADEMTSEYQAGMFRFDRNKIPGWNNRSREGIEGRGELVF